MTLIYINNDILLEVHNHYLYYIYIYIYIYIFWTNRKQCHISLRTEGITSSAVTSYIHWIFYKPFFMEILSYFQRPFNKENLLFFRFKMPPRVSSISRFCNLSCSTEELCFYFRPWINTYKISKWRWCVYSFIYYSIIEVFITDCRLFNTSICQVKSRKVESVFSDRTEDLSALQYFQFYGYLSQQQNMLQDFIRTFTYQRAILSNLNDFKVIKSQKMFIFICEMWEIIFIVTFCLFM